MRDGWIYKKLGEACLINCGTRVVQKKDGGSIYPVYGGGGATFKMDTYNREDCLVVARFAMSKQCTRFVKGKFFLNDSGLTVASKNSDLTQPYLDRVIFSLNDKIYNSGKGVAQKNLDMKEFKSLQIPIPPITTQQQIVSELDLLSHILDQKRQQLKEYDALAESIFYDMFGDPVENPKGWEVKKLGDICNISSSKRIFANEYVDEGIPFYRGKEVTEKSKGLDPTLELFISRDRYAQIKESFGVPKVGDILITAVGTIGNIWVVDNDDPFYFKDGNIIWLSQISNIDPIYFRKVLEILISAFKLEMSNGCAYCALTIVNLKKMGANLPPLTLQRSFASKIESIEHQKQLLKESIKETEMLFQSRMDYWFNG